MQGTREFEKFRHKPVTRGDRRTPKQLFNRDKRRARFCGGRGPDGSGAITPVYSLGGQDNA